MLRLEYLSLGFCSFLLAACSSNAGLEKLTADIAQPAPVVALATDAAPTEVSTPASGEAISSNAKDDAPAVVASAEAASVAEPLIDRLAPPANVSATEVQPGAAVIAAIAPANSQTPDPVTPAPVTAYAAPNLPAVAPDTHFEAKGAVKPVEPRSAELNSLIGKYAAIYEVPESLVHRVVKRESNYDPKARNKIYWGLMQIRHDTAQTMGYRGPASGLLDAETNLKYAVKYLRGAYLTADRNESNAVGFYARGYYYDAKRKGLLKVTGLRP